MKIYQLKTLNHNLLIFYRNNYFRFGFIFIKKIIKSKLKKKTETGSNLLVSVRFDFLEQNTVQTGLARVFSVRFNFFGFKLKKPKPNRTSHFFSKF